MKKIIYLFIITAFIGVACSNEEEETFYVPKQRGYLRINLPEPKYVQTPDSLPYSFEYSAHAKLLNDTSVVTERYWFELYYPQFTSNIDISYRKINNNKNFFRDYVNDSHTLVGKHHFKASGITETTFKTAKGYSAIVFELRGDVPSQFQFYVTDSTQNFLRASLYFPTNLHNDSLAPVIDFVKEDMLHMIRTLEWKKK